MKIELTYIYIHTRDKSVTIPLRGKKRKFESQFPIRMVSGCPFCTFEYRRRARKPLQIFKSKIVSEHRYSLYDRKRYGFYRGLALFMSIYIKATDTQWLATHTWTEASQLL